MPAGPVRICCPLPVSLDLTLAPLPRGGRDPHTRRAKDGAWWLAQRTADGPATLRLEADGDAIAASAWGPGAERALAGAPALVGVDDDLQSFTPTGVVAELSRRMPGLRMTRTGAVLPALTLAILEQKVAGKHAFRSYLALLRILGEPAPGDGALPFALLLPPDPARLAALADHELRPLGIESRRARTLLSVARRAARLERLSELPPADARARLEALPGIGPWTSAEVARVAWGDADAVSVGDYHLPNVVAFNLAGEPRADDARMLELLAPFAGHRGRVQRLLEQGGKDAPRYGPRRPLPNLRHW